MEMKKKKENIIYDVSLLSEYDLYLINEGNHSRLYEKLGSHLMTVDKTPGALFAVWAPNAHEVSVIGDFNGWNTETHPLRKRNDSSGIWEGFIPGIEQGYLYKYSITLKHHHKRTEKTDPFAFRWEISPKSASIVHGLGYEWNDSTWIEKRKQSDTLNKPISIYEVHLGSWRRVSDENNRFLTYRETAEYLVDYVLEMGFTHVEFMPVMEHPFYGSWGYQVLGYFAPTSRYGTPQDFMFLVDCLHQNGIGVILDWVPSHFPNDEHGLFKFDGTHLYEHEDVRKGFHPEWESCIFNYGRNEVRSFLISSAEFWIDKYHADGLRVDAVASMLYLDYARKKGEWIPNEYGGKENIEAIVFMQRLNEILYGRYPGIHIIAEESTAWPMVTSPTYRGGLGFGIKWNMGWMNDTLSYFSKNPIYRKYNQNQLTFSLVYAFSENFLLPLSHDEVVHGKGSLFGKMPGDEWQKFANLRLLFGYMFTHPGKKLLFMGIELGQWSEWKHDQSLEWDVLEYPQNSGISQWIRDLNSLYKNEPALFEFDFTVDGFEWIDCGDYENSIVSYLRKGTSAKDNIVVVCNLTPVPRYNYSIGVPAGGMWRELLNSDAVEYDGSGLGNMGGVEADSISNHGRPYSLRLTLPPLGVVIFKNQGNKKNARNKKNLHTLCR